MKRLLLAAILLAAAVVHGNATTRVLTAQMELNVPVEKAWTAWTTTEGIKTFFAPGGLIEPQVDGLYEIYFMPAAKPGLRGADGMRVLGFEPMRRLAFTWNAPPSIPEIRGQRTMVVLEFEAVSATRSRVRFTHLGWGEGKSWDAAYEYFDKAWNAIVLPRFRRAMEVGPIDWKQVPTLEPIMPTMKVAS
jgi:uncharacterized protein YndB with AHSA1/START domain